jgi:hypothetical protein
MAKPKSFQAQVSNILDALADSVSKRRDGSIVIRRGFYYRHGADAESYRIAVCKKLNAAGLDYSIKDYGEKWAAFRGGASLTSQSHWWVEIWPPVDTVA